MTSNNGNGAPTDFIGSGWSFPLRVNARGGIALSHGDQDVGESIRIILSTPIGERRMRPRFGCGVHDLTFATNDPATHGLIRYHVVQALTLWEPRIELPEDGVRVRVDPDEPARVLVEIDYILRSTNEMRNLVFPFYLIPGESER
ncbi:MAG TPA: GPW/gp25 family protein [Chloroflexota bacterium]